MQTHKSSLLVLMPAPSTPQFFQKAALNVRDNVGEEVDAEQLIQEACRSCLEQVRPRVRLRKVLCH